MVSDIALIFHMCIPCGKTFSLIPRSRPPVKVHVKNQGHIFTKKWPLGVGGISISLVVAVVCVVQERV